MGLQKYRADTSGVPCPNGAVPWYSNWMGGPLVSLIRNCPTPMGPRTVYIQGDADTFFSLPAACYYKGYNVRGYVICTDGDWEFRVSRCKQCQDPKHDTCSLTPFCPCCEKTIKEMEEVL